MWSCHTNGGQNNPFCVTYVTYFYGRSSHWKTWLRPWMHGHGDFWSALPSGCSADCYRMHLTFTSFQWKSNFNPSKWKTQTLLIFSCYLIATELAHTSDYFRAFHANANLMHLGPPSFPSRCISEWGNLINRIDAVSELNSEICKLYVRKHETMHSGQKQT